MKTCVLVDTLPDPKTQEMISQYFPGEIVYLYLRNYDRVGAMLQLLKEDVSNEIVILVNEAQNDGKITVIATMALCYLNVFSLVVMTENNRVPGMHIRFEKGKNPIIHFSRIY